MAKFTVYHLPGWKFGCTSNLDKRRKDYAPHQTRLLKIVAVLDDAKAASELEAKLNKLAGYKQQHQEYRHSIDIAPLGGKATVERGHNNLLGMPREERQATGRKGGLIGGRVIAERKLGIHALPQEARAQNGRKGGKRAAEVIGPERLAEKGRRMGSLRGQCPVCGTITNAGNLAQHHGERCKQKKLPLRRPA